LKFTADFLISQTCKTTKNPFGKTCSAAETAIKFAGVPTAKCTDTANGGCDCAVGNTLKEDTTKAYSTLGNVLTSTNPKRTYDYCVAGNEIKFKETTSGSVPAILVLKK
jgi:hypothetical protein